MSGWSNQWWRLSSEFTPERTYCLIRVPPDMGWNFAKLWPQPNPRCGRYSSIPPGRFPPFPPTPFPDNQHQTITTNNYNQEKNHNLQSAIKETINNQSDSGFPPHMSRIKSKHYLFSYLQLNQKRKNSKILPEQNLRVVNKDVSCNHWKADNFSDIHNPAVTRLQLLHLIQRVNLLQRGEPRKVELIITAPFLSGDAFQCCLRQRLFIVKFHQTLFQKSKKFKSTQ